LSTLKATGFDAIINLCGYNIASARWNIKVKEQLIQSRVSTNEKLLNWLITKNAKPHFICANAVGIYGLQANGDPTELHEDSPIDFMHPQDFLSEIGIRWQESLSKAAEHGIPVTTTRFGVVLKKGQGVLKKLYPSFFMGMGSVLGDGQQVISWVHITDVIAALLFLLNRPELTGAFNITSPNPVNQAQFAHLLAQALHRPLFLKMPKWIISALLGEMGDALLLKGQRVVPKRLLEEGYSFIFPQCANALSQEFQ
jgi:uncharacterized protein (TIGR01777 family)